MKKAGIKPNELAENRKNPLSTGSHEVRTSIAIAQESLALCLEEKTGPLNSIQRKLLVNAQNSVDGLAGLILDLMDGFQVEEKELELRKRPIDFQKWIRALFDGFKAQGVKRGIEIIVKGPEKPIQIYTDEEKIKLIFEGLVKFLFQHAKSMKTLIVDMQDQKECIQSCVSIIGWQPSHESMGALFPREEHQNPMRDRAYHGSEYTLALSKRLIERLGGQIWINSHFQDKATFCFTLKKIPFPKILVVHRESASLNQIERLLSEDGYRLVSTTDGQTAIDQADNELPDLILLDENLMIPNVDEIIGRLKQNRRTHRIPILLISSGNGEAKTKFSQASQAVIPTMSYPFEEARLREKVLEMLF